MEPGCIVITHHLPHVKSIAPQYAGNSLNRFFYARGMDQHVESGLAKLWIHGHTHEPCDYVAPGGTRVVCNPRGYPGEHSRDYKQLVIEV